MAPKLDYVVSMQRFRFLNLVDLRLGLDDLFGKRHPALLASNMGKSYEPMLQEKRTVIYALPAAQEGGIPLAEELATTDDDHDGFGGALWHMTEAYLRLPNKNVVVVERVKRIRAALIPALSEVNESYADEANAAIARKAELPQLETDLKSIPVAMGGASLYDWAKGFLGAGEKLSALLSDRADATPGGRSEASKLRSETIAILNRARRALADECAISKVLPSDLDGQVWGYLDELEGFRADAVARARKEAKVQDP